MRKIICLLLLFVWTISASGAAPKVGDVVFFDDFNSETSPDQWSKHDSVRFVEKTPGDPSDRVVYVDIPKSAGEGNASIKIPIDPQNLGGSVVRLSARIKSEDVEKPPVAYNGIDIQLYVQSPTQKYWHQRSDLYGTGDWREISCEAAIPSDVERIVLSVGLEKTNGRLWVDDVAISIHKARRIRPAVKALYDGNGRRKSVYTGHTVPRLRGAMISPHKFHEEDIRVLAGEWKANHIRWQMNWGFPHGRADTATIEEFNAWVDSESQKLDKMLPLCRKYGVAVCLDLHTSPGGRDKASNGRMFERKEYQDAFIATWVKLAKKYKDEPAIWGYDLLNEPTETKIPEGKGILNWRDLAEKTALTIREIDPIKPIIVEPAPWGGPDALDFFEPINAPNIVYSVHMYMPHAFTHQGVYNNPLGFEYPGEVNGVYWDKERLREALRPAIEFQEDYGVQLYLGEFSAIRWAPNDSAYRYLRDVIDLFEEYQWDWAYHAFREWSGWSVEHSGPPEQEERAAEPTDREQLLRAWYEKNERAE